MNAHDRAKKVHEAMTITIESLTSHLEWTHEKHPDGASFHKKAVGDYIRLLNTLNHLW